MRLEQVTITGVDDNVEMSLIDEMTSRFSHVEWGVLLSEKKKGSPRYPSDRWLAELTSTYYHKYDATFAAHVCGSLCDRLIADAGASYIIGELIEFTDPRFFARIQLNSYPDSDWDHSAVNRLASNLGTHADIILPIPNEKVLEKVRFTFLMNVNFLHDRSRGKGITPEEWPPADLEGYVGYAGGIDPDNVRSVLDTLCGRDDDHGFWIDMETGVRTDDRLDPEKIEKILTITEDYL